MALPKDLFFTFNIWMQNQIRMERICKAKNKSTNPLYSPLLLRVGGVDHTTISRMGRLPSPL